MPDNIREKYLIAFAAIAVFALLFWSSYAFQSSINNFLGFLEKYLTAYPLIGSIIFFVFAALSAVISPFTSAPLIPAAIAIFGNFLTFWLLWIGWIFGGIISYFLGRYAARPIAINLLTSKKINYYQKKLSKKTNFWLILLFRIAAPAEIPGPILGALKYNPLKFIFATAIAELPYAIASIYASNALITDQKIIFFLSIILIFAIMSAAYFILHKKIN
ncbi:MAG: hypothetical protein UT31_C0040G0003 [Parcubacteria group bacterium GW2011_GWF2_39_13b]|nr:MAG: hypothetical protein UT31_C0040G0003 [Parcubacteria group bacterium GW2011_GWF2_39_13b]